jgi:hypothetical protein
MLEAGEATKNMPKTRAWRSNQKIWKVKKLGPVLSLSIPTQLTPCKPQIWKKITGFRNMFDQSCLSDHTW